MGMQTPKIKLIKMYVVVASTLGAINLAHAMYDPCLDPSGSGCNVLSSQSKINHQGRDENKVLSHEEQKRILEILKKIAK